MGYLDKESPEYFLTIGMILGLILFASILGPAGMDSPYTRLQESSPEQDIIMPGKIWINVSLNGVEYVYQN